MPLLNPADPLTLQAVQWVADQIARIDGAPNWRTDIGNTVSVEPQQFDLRDPQLLALVVANGVAEPVSEASTARLKQMRLPIQINVVIPASLDNSHALQHAAMEDVRRALGGRNLPAYPAGMAKHEIQDSEFAVEIENLNSIVVVVNVVATITETIINPQ